MKKAISIVLLLAMVLSLTACGKGGKKKEDLGVEKLVADYGFQWTDPNAPILNEQGAQDLSFTIYSSKNASALDYNDMKIMQDLFAATNVNVFWENVSESVYTQQKNLIFSNKDDRPDAIYHAGMSAGEIIKYVVEEDPTMLTKPVRVLGALNAPIPSGYAEGLMMPHAEDVIAAVNELMA